MLAVLAVLATSPLSVSPLEMNVSFGSLISQYRMAGLISEETGLARPKREARLRNDQSK